MKRHLLFLLSLFIVLNHSNIIAQQDLNTCSSGISTSDFPFVYYEGNYSWSAGLYTPGQVGSSQIISSLNFRLISSLFYSGDSFVIPGIKIYLRHTSVTDYNTPGNGDYPGTGGFTKVYEGNITYSANGVYTIPFSTTFSYNGTDNLELLIENEGGIPDFGGDLEDGDPVFTRTDLRTDGIRPGKLGFDDWNWSGAKNQSSLQQFTLAVIFGNNSGSYSPCHVYPLPVTFTAFTSTCQNNDRLLSWTTASETNNDYFTIDYSDDGEKWEEVAKVKGFGNSSESHTYSYQHRPLSVESSTIYYRIKQTDFDGEETYLQTISSICQSSNEALISPNPTMNKFKVYNLSSDDIVIVYNPLGNLISQSLSETNFMEVDLTAYPAGVYFVNVLSKEHKQILKVIKK